MSGSPDLVDYAADGLAAFADTVCRRTMQHRLAYDLFEFQVIEKRSEERKLLDRQIKGTQQLKTPAEDILHIRITEHAADGSGNLMANEWLPGRRTALLHPGIARRHGPGRGYDGPRARLPASPR